MASAPLRTVCLALGACLVFAPGLVHASKIYTCKNDRGNPVYQETPCQGRASEQVYLDGKPDEYKPKFRFRPREDLYYPEPEEEPEDISLGQDDSSAALAALREGKRECGSRHAGRSEDQLLKFAEMLGELDDEERRVREQMEIECHLNYLSLIERVRYGESLEDQIP